MPDPGSARTKPLQCYVNKEQSKTVVTTPDAVPEGQLCLGGWNFWCFCRPPRTACLSPAGQGFAAVDQGALGVVFDWQPKALRHGVLLPLQVP